MTCSRRTLPSEMGIWPWTKTARDVSVRKQMRQSPTRAGTALRCTKKDPQEMSTSRSVRDDHGSTRGVRRRAGRAVESRRRKGAWMSVSRVRQAGVYSIAASIVSLHQDGAATKLLSALSRAERASLRCGLAGQAVKGLTVNARRSQTGLSTYRS